MYFIRDSCKRRNKTSLGIDFGNGIITFLNNHLNVMNDMKKMTLLTGILLCLLVSSCGKDEETETGGATGGYPCTLRGTD